jgi:hypothetical protein
MPPLFGIRTTLIRVHSYYPEGCSNQKLLFLFLLSRQDVEGYHLQMDPKSSNAMKNQAI